MLQRVLEPELMDTEADAAEYDAMDHSAVNARFAEELLTAIGRWGRSACGPTVLDLGAGTALIPIELCRRDSALHVVAVDAAESMLSVARRNVDAADLADRIELVLADAKDLPFDPAQFSIVVSNSIVHHIAEPERAVAESLRVATGGALLFHRDLARPASAQQVAEVVAAYAGDATPHQQKLFADSLRAALTLEEMRHVVRRFGFDAATVQMTSDRHWTWQATKPGTP
jgi:ubiquinone/menaquinone biosynthesis C-methylase UbiE